MTLYTSTKDLHHACEAHPIGQLMFRGEITSQQWADWLYAFRLLHASIDHRLPSIMARDLFLWVDLRVLPSPNQSKAASVFAQELSEAEDITGAAYVLHGAHCSGGRVLGPKMVKRRLPVMHIFYSDYAKVESWLNNARGTEKATPQARATFETLLRVMDEIAERPK